MRSTKKLLFIIDTKDMRMTQWIQHFHRRRQNDVMSLLVDSKPDDTENRFRNILNGKCFALTIDNIANFHTWWPWMIGFSQNAAIFVGKCKHAWRWYSSAKTNTVSWSFCRFPKTMSQHKDPNWETYGWWCSMISHWISRPDYICCVKNMIIFYVLFWVPFVIVGSLALSETINLTMSSTWIAVCFFILSFIFIIRWAAIALYFATN